MAIVLFDCLAAHSVEFFLMLILLDNRRTYFSCFYAIQSCFFYQFWIVTGSRFTTNLQSPFLPGAFHELISLCLLTIGTISNFWLDLQTVFYLAIDLLPSFLRHLVTIRNDDANFFFLTPISNKACLSPSIYFLLGWLALLPITYFPFPIWIKRVHQNIVERFLFFGGINTYLKQTESVEYNEKWFSKFSIW